MTTTPQTRQLPTAFLWAVGFNMIWMNISEVFRYFAFVMPMMREAMHVIPEVAPMNLPVFLIWGIWDTLLVLAVTAITWLALDRFGETRQSQLATATGIWASIFVVLWLGLYNMNLAPLSVALVALPLAWVEIAVAVWLVHIARKRGRG